MLNEELINMGWKFNNTYINLPDVFYTYINPAMVKKPELVIYNGELADSLGIDLSKLDNKEIAEIFVGNKIIEGSKPIAQAYAGHQFGYFTMLGDGRAHLLGEHITSSGYRVDVQLKGSGRTPYSRGGDGRAAIGPMIREYIISEGMHALNIPTTRSLAVVTTGEAVFREKVLKGAILTRIAKSHLRVGTFQYAANFGTVEDLKTLADYTIERHYPHLANENNKYILLYREIVSRQAILISKWMLVGFIHGVMNTDNMTISGETIDYGPCAFMDTYNSNTVFSSIDTNGRYAYGNQPSIGEWNLSQLAVAMLPLFHDIKDEAIKIASDELSAFNKEYEENWLKGMRDKLGIFNKRPEDEKLIKDLLNIMEKNQSDYTNTFLSLTLEKMEDTELYHDQEFKNWFNLWEERLKRQDESREESLNLMRKSNPVVIPRNHRVEEALSAAETGDLSVMNKLLNALAKPFDYTMEQEYTKLPPKSSCSYRTFCGT